MSTTIHHIPRAEWEQKFRAQFVTRLGEDPGDKVIAAELESWPTSEDDWRAEQPEDAADSNLSYWDSDGEAAQ